MLRNLRLSAQGQRYLFWGSAALLVLSTFVGTLLEFPPLFAAPLALLVGYWALYDFRKVFYVLLFFLPFTMKYYLPGGVALSFPAEVLTVLLMVVYLGYLLVKKTPPLSLIRHPIIGVLLLHVLWIFITAIFAQKKLIAFKFFLAKIWFVTTFVFVTALFIKTLDDFKKAFWVILVPLMVTVLYVLHQHALLNFSFDFVNQSVQPFYHNHVNYAAVLSLFLPFMLAATRWYAPKTVGRRLLWGCIGIIFFAIIVSYTRGAWLALLCGGVFYIALQRKFVGWLVGAGFAVLFLVGFHLVDDNKYLDYAPEYGKAVYHANISAHLEATIQVQDVSTAERFFRWVGGIRMIDEYPVTGFGPRNFYHFYKRHTVTSFTTYVSENPAKSGVHNYFLMTVIEQGWIGLLLFGGLTFLIFYRGVRLFHRLTDKKYKQLVAALLTSLVIINIQICLSDLIEAMKIGSFYFINIAILVNFDRFSVSNDQKEPNGRDNRSMSDN